MSQPAQSYLLRLWREQTTAPLRATLISVAQPEASPRHFTSLAELFAFLQIQTGETNGTDDKQFDTNCTAPETD